MLISNCCVRYDDGARNLVTNEHLATRDVSGDSCANLSVDSSTDAVSGVEAPSSFGGGIWGGLILTRVQLAAGRVVESGMRAHRVGGFTSTSNFCYICGYYKTMFSSLIKDCFELI